MCGLCKFSDCIGQERHVEAPFQRMPTRALDACMRGESGENDLLNLRLVQRL